jgi:hypothetical protein
MCSSRTTQEQSMIFPVFPDQFWELWRAWQLSSIVQKKSLFGGQKKWQ